MSPLYFKDITEYARIVGYRAADDLLFFADMMAACDSVFLTLEAEKMKAKRQQDEAKAKAARGRRSR